MSFLLQLHPIWKKMKSHDLLFGVDSKIFNDFYANKGITPGKFKLNPVSVDD